MMIEIGKHPEFNTIYVNPGVSKYEVWYNKNELGELSIQYHFISKRRYILPTIAYILYLIVMVGGFIAVFLGIVYKQGDKIMWGTALLVIGILYLTSQYRVVKNMENHLFAKGIGNGMSRWDIKIRKDLMKKLGKRYWFAFLPFSAIEWMETKKITSETSGLFIHTKDGKIWPHPKYGIPYNRTLKGDVEFINEIFEQYERWKSENVEVNILNQSGNMGKEVNGTV